jgi:ATP-dependent Clp protease ATP-binding subunit ClpA
LLSSLLLALWTTIVIEHVTSRVALATLSAYPWCKENHQYIGTEHLLLGLVREDEGIAARVLVEVFGVNLEKVRTQTIQVLSQSGSLG